VSNTLYIFSFVQTPPSAIITLMDMLTKEHVLSEVKRLAQERQLTFDELKQAFTSGAPAQNIAESSAEPATKTADGRMTHLTNSLYIAGAVIVTAAIGFLIMQNWNELGTAARILVTVGLGLVLMFAGWWRARLNADSNKDILASSLLMIGCFAIALGAYVTAYEFNPHISRFEFTAITTVLAGAFAALYLFMLRNLVFLIFSVAMATVALYVAIDWFLFDVNHWVGSLGDFYDYVTAFVGAGYIALSRLFARHKVAGQASDMMYVFGCLLILTSMLWLTFMQTLPRGEYFDLIYPFIIAGVLMLSAYFRTKQGVFMSVLFLSIYIFEICYEYFANALGGSFALLLGGALVMGLAYAANMLSKRYLKS
jgi:hypothetical protein